MKPQETDALLGVLEGRFHRYEHRHAGLAWKDVRALLEGRPAALKALASMEQTGGEPDVVDHDPSAARVVFFDCSAESPSGRRSLCYDGTALQERKEHKPQGSAVDLAREIGVSLLTPEQYVQLQAVGEFDTKTSSWLCTPAEVRALGGALFGDRRYGRVFTYHNGAQSYYAARGFRGALAVE